jgi:hypothetical protein
MKLFPLEKIQEVKLFLFVILRFEGTMMDYVFNQPIVIDPCGIFLNVSAVLYNIKLLTLQKTVRSLRVF